MQHQSPATLEQELIAKFNRKADSTPKLNAVYLSNELRIELISQFRPAIEYYQNALPKRHASQQTPLFLIYLLAGLKKFRLVPPDAFLNALKTWIATPEAEDLILKNLTPDYFELIRLIALFSSFGIQPAQLVIKTIEILFKKHESEPVAFFSWANLLRAMTFYPALNHEHALYKQVLEKAEQAIAVEPEESFTDLANLAGQVKSAAESKEIPASKTQIKFGSTLHSAYKAIHYYLTVNSLDTEHPAASLLKNSRFKQGIAILRPVMHRIHPIHISMIQTIAENYLQTTFAQQCVAKLGAEFPVLVAVESEKLTDSLNFVDLAIKIRISEVKFLLIYVEVQGPTHFYKTFAGETVPPLFVDTNEVLYKKETGNDLIYLSERYFQKAPMHQRVLSYDGQEYLRTEINKRIVTAMTPFKSVGSAASQVEKSLRPARRFALPSLPTPQVAVVTEPMCATEEPLPVKSEPVSLPPASSEPVAEPVNLNPEPSQPLPNIPENKPVSLPPPPQQEAPPKLPRKSFCCKSLFARTPADEVNQIMREVKNNFIKQQGGWSFLYYFNENKIAEIKKFILANNLQAKRELLLPILKKKFGVAKPVRGLLSNYVIYDFQDDVLTALGKMIPAATHNKRYKRRG